MRTTCSRCSLKFAALVAALFLSAHIFLSFRGKQLATPPPLPPEDYRALSPHSYRYVLNQPDACRDRSPFLLLLVPVAPHEAAARAAVRSTWGTPRADTRTLFYAGLGEGGLRSASQAELEEESRRHADVIQMDFRDSYANLTIKTVMMMNWVAAHCPRASYVMKVDADIFVNVVYLLRRLRSCPRRGFITGSVISDGAPRRDSSSKWFVSENVYPENRFPPYVSGAGYVFSADLAARISWASRFVRLVPLEDVYVGLCLRVLGVRPVYSFSLVALRDLFEVQELDYNRCTFSRLLIVNGFTPPKLLQAWQDFSRRPLCSRGD